MVSIYYVLAPFPYGKRFSFLNPLAKRLSLYPYGHTMSVRVKRFPWVTYTCPISAFIELSEVKFYAKRKGT